MLSLNEIRREVQKYKTKISIEEISELDVSCRSLLTRYIDNDSLNSSAAIKIQSIIDYMHEQINIGNWKKVKPYIRKTITLASYLKLLVLLMNCDELTEEIIRDIFKIIDFGLLFGCPLEKHPKLLQNCAEILSFFQIPTLPLKDELIDECKINNRTIQYLDTVSIETIKCPSMETFFNKYILKDMPVVLENCINHWPALEKWKDQNYLIKLAGMRTVPIELGNKYTDTEWTQQMMTLEEFIKNHIYQRNGQTGYLAQHQLFDQIPELKNDISEPEYCCFSNDNTPVDIMAWFGPRGTVSPLHHDPKRNLLAQVVGEKQLFLFSPVDSEKLYPYDDDLLSNTARIDPREPDLEKYPKYKGVKGYYCKLHPGQMLYIPPKWWHFVESLSISFSVSFWWN